MRQILAEVAEALGNADRVTAGIAHLSRHDQDVGRVLVERLVGAEAQLAGLGGPHDVVDTDGGRRRQPNVPGVEVLVLACEDFLVPRKGITQATRKTVWLVTLEGSMSPSKGTEIRAFRLNPSS